MFEVALLSHWPSTERTVMFLAMLQGDDSTASPRQLPTPSVLLGKGFSTLSPVFGRWFQLLSTHGCLSMPWLRLGQDFM